MKRSHNEYILLQKKLTGIWQLFFLITTAIFLMVGVYGFALLILILGLIFNTRFVKFDNRIAQR